MILFCWINLHRWKYFGHFEEVRVCPTCFKRQETIDYERHPIFQKWDDY